MNKDKFVWKAGNVKIVKSGKDKESKPEETKPKAKDEKKDEPKQSTSGT